MEKLLVAVLGNRNSGKSHTWNKLFKRTVRTGKNERNLYFNDCEYVKVFLVSGSAEERGEYVGDLIVVDNPKIVLCSIQYTKEAKDSFNYFIEKDFFIFCHWLNPGFYDNANQSADQLGLVNWLLSKGYQLGLRDGTISATERVDEMKNFIYEWAASRNLILNKCD